ncbi:MAG: RnfABCDGE type electron transport complex subunit D [Granulosicoccus sp.]
MNGLTIDTSTVNHQRRSVAFIMLHVIAALLPGIAVYSLLIDSRLLPNILIAGACAVFFESILVMIRKRAVRPVLKDASIVLAALLLVLSIPQSLPVWQLILGILVMCTLGKHVFGGLGHNPFNPAMVAYAFLIVSFPVTMTQWSSDQGVLDSPAASQSARVNLSNDEQQRQAWDSLSGATPLDRLATLKRDTSQASVAAGDIESASVDSTQLILSSDWVWLSLAWLVGGVYLLLMRIISWRIPLSVITTIWCSYFLFGLFSTVTVLPATVALFSGAIMLGAFFIATDPVSAATSDTGKLVYGAGIGVLCFFIREFSAYPEGMAFAVLLMNMCVPLIDHAFTRNRLPKANTGNTPPDNPRK